jgi:glutathione transport system substrate-binding protein
MLALTVSVVAVLALAACSTGSASSGSGGAVRAGGSITVAVDEPLAGFNPLYTNDSETVLGQMLDQVWPHLFIVEPNLTQKLNTALLTSAKVVKTSPQTVIYRINPRATWSDGVPISAADFSYNWKALSGDPTYRDVGGARFQPYETAGYSQIKSVTGSGRGKVVTVVFRTPFSDWQSLFTPMIPAHIAEKVGFNQGFQNFGPAERVSGGPYEMQSYSPGQDLVEVRNPHYWGTPGKLDKIIFRFIVDDSAAPPAVQNGEVNVVNPTLASSSYYQAVKAVPSFKVSVRPSLAFQHLDFNEANPYLARHAIREAIAAGTDRADIVRRIADPMGIALSPLNNRIYMPTQPQYRDASGGRGAFNPGRARTLLRQAGMTMGADGYFHPRFGPEKGQDFSLTVTTTTGVPVRTQIEELFQAEMRTVGVKISVKNYPSNVMFGSIAPRGQFDIIEFAWAGSPFPSGNQSIYCSYSGGAACGENWDHSADSRVDALFDQALRATSPSRAAALYNRIDSVLWQDMATLPLFQQPELFGWSTSYGGVVPNTSDTGLLWNAGQWGLKA